MRFKCTDMYLSSPPFFCTCVVPQSQALAGYSATAVDDNLGMAKFWLPVNLLVYSAPIYLRMPMNHVASLVWCCILSHSQGNTMQTAAADKDGAAHLNRAMATVAGTAVSSHRHP